MTEDQTCHMICLEGMVLKGKETVRRTWLSVLLGECFTKIIT